VGGLGEAVVRVPPLTTRRLSGGARVCYICAVRDERKQELSFLAWVLWAIVAGLLLAPFVIAAAGGTVPAPAFLHGHGPF
jgi:hypothetical protein